jgi:hypothetical protein
MIRIQESGPGESRENLRELAIPRHDLFFKIYKIFFVILK